MEDEMILGSGYLYITEFTTAIPADGDFETAANKLGYIEGGASLEYKPTFYTAKDDLGLVTKTVITDEEVTLKSGICTLNGNTLKKLSATARVTEVGSTRTVKIGGIANNDGKQYAIRFVHADGDIRVTIVGQNQSGFTLAFAKDKETIVDAEFKALPCDNEGTLVIFSETIAGVLESLTVTSVAGTAIGKTKVTLLPALTYGRTYVYKTAASVTAPVLDGVLNDWQVWDGVSDITATTGNKIGIAEIDSALQCKAYGFATVTSRA